MIAKRWQNMTKRQPALPWLLGSGVASLGVLIAIVSSAMGAPLVTATDITMALRWLKFLLQGVGFVALAVGAGLMTAVIVLPIRNRLLARKWHRDNPKVARVAQQEEPEALKIKLWQPRRAASDSATIPQVAPIDHSGVWATEREHRLMLKGLEGLCTRYLEGERPNGAEAMLKSLEALLARLTSAPIPMVAAAPEEGEGQRALTYEAVLALLAAGNVGIKHGREIVRKHGGRVGRDYSQLQEILSLLPSPIGRSVSKSSDFTVVNHEHERESGPVNVPHKSVNHKQAMSRTPPRRKRRRNA